MANIHIMECDDWIAVYNDGTKVYEGHSCPLSMGLVALGIKFTSEYLDVDDEDDLDFPDTLL